MLLHVYTTVYHALISVIDALTCIYYSVSCLDQCDRCSYMYILLLQITVAVQDGATPPNPATTTFVVTVTVIRNTEPPIFFEQTYYREISENLGVNQEVLTVSANDADTTVLFYIIIDEQIIIIIKLALMVTLNYRSSAVSGQFKNPSDLIYMLF